MTNNCGGISPSSFDLDSSITTPLVCRAAKKSCYSEYIFWFLLIATVITLGFFFGLGSPCSKKARSYGAIVSNGEGCAEIGGKMLNDGGSAADAAIATLLCEGVVLPHSMGVGGGFMATYYDKLTDRVETLIARETAPAAATSHMFKHKNITGAISAGVPSEIFGYWRLHEKYGRLPWKDLFTPTIKLCRNGIKVSKFLGDVLRANKKRIRAEPSMAEIFINPCTRKVYQENDIMYRKKLAKTLEIIANEGMEVLYRGGCIGKMLVEDIKEMGGIITEQDLQDYEVRWELPIVTSFTNGFQLYTTPLPSSGPLLAFILRVMEPLNTSDINVYSQRLVETFKHAYGRRTNLGDHHFEPQVEKTYRQLLNPAFAAEIRDLIEDDCTSNDLSFYGADYANCFDFGTANIVVLSTNGDAISVTSTINSHFGAKVRSRQTGFILNDEMDDFSTPGKRNIYGISASPANYIKPGKRPMSSICPSLVFDKYGNIKLLLGGSGGSRITTSVAQTILRYFVLDYNLKDSVNMGRIHHQLLPMRVDLEHTVPQKVGAFLRSVGHRTATLRADRLYSSVTAIGLKNGVPEAICDDRRYGSTMIVNP